MNRRSLRVLASFLGVAFAASCLPGCQYSYEYEVRGTIRDASGASPLAGVGIALGATGLFAEPGPTLTSANGTFALRFRVSDGEFSPVGGPRWSLTLKKEGYADEVIDISPGKEPDSSKATNQIIVAAYMRAK